MHALPATFSRLMRLLPINEIKPETEEDATHVKCDGKLELSDVLVTTVCVSVTTR